MESPNTGGDNVSARQLSPPSETFGAESGLQLVELWAKGVPWNPTHISDYC